MLPADCSRRLVAELRGALDACAERQLQLEQSLRVCRRLLRAWEPVGTLAPEPLLGPETKEQDPSTACTPSPKDIKELELLTQALEKAVRVRKGISKAGERDKTPSLKSGSFATSSGTIASTLPQASGQAGSRASDAKCTRDIRQTTVPAKGHPEHRLPSAGERAHVREGAQATRPGPRLRDQQVAPSAAPQNPEAFTLKEKGSMLQLPTAFRKEASQNSRLWAQLSSAQSRDSMDAIAAKTQFLQKMQAASGQPGPALSAAEVEAEMGHLKEACSQLRLRMREELSAAPTDWTQEYRCLLTLEGLWAIAGRCLHRLQQLHTVLAEQPLGPCPVGRPSRVSVACGGGADPSRSPQLLLYSSTQELQTLAALRLRVAMLNQQIHLEKVLMAELLPLVSSQGQPSLALCRAMHSLLCEGGERFLTILHDDPDPAD
ncbi:tubulin epsilon and delta complex protein 2 isoform X1 [Nycticebus coucang]|uniref:tubulin epsilon and delta complex protein 2 isoform X1 n=1 Tax=Nycticebus coucang TaxID=9470 RepID=UPI00234C1823|nr:tubulin epsilon and delta complex protein 2 isoform X1 [Nycticebus coucang]